MLDRVVHRSLSEYDLDRNSRAEAIGLAVGGSKAEVELMRWMKIILVAAIVVVSAEVLATLPARQSRIMTVYVRNSADSVLEAFRSASLTAGLRCQSVDVGDNRAFQCRPSESNKTFERYVEAVDVTRHHAVFVSAYSSDKPTWRALSGRKLGHENLPQSYCTRSRRLTICGVCSA